jgi:3-dehydroquinate synthase
MVCAARLSERVCALVPGATARLEALVSAARLPVAPPPIKAERWLELMRHDKKVERGVLRFVLLDSLGQAVVRSEIAEGDLLAVLS